MTLRERAEAAAKDMLNERDNCDASREAWVMTFADAVERVAKEHAAIVASKFNCEMEDSTGVMFGQQQKDKILAAAERGE